MTDRISSTAVEPKPTPINFDAFITALKKQKPEAGGLILDENNILRIVDVKGNEMQNFDFTRFDGIEQFFGMADSIITVE
ncbi:MAG: hypothetical protein DYG97_10255 [Ignavibacteria bacterium CHB3]|nr:hypothetical protein [Ignavibacteria bacterium CHB3]